MASEMAFLSASPYQDDILALPVTDLDQTAQWYCEHFGMTEVQRCDAPAPSVILERDGTRIGFAINGGDASQAGAAIRVTNIGDVKDDLESRGVTISNWRIDDRDGQKHQVFFVVAPDGLCYYFYEPIDPE
ncbi:MAG: VOC family protein [Pirellulaceae bacterium]|nr:VOC family protein [Pirellulaceae bacterium]